MGAVAPSRRGPIGGVSVIVLAGGESSRLGRDKASVRLGGETLLERAVRLLAPLGGEVIVVRGAGRSKSVPQRVQGAREVEDVYPGMGPLAGIHAGLSASDSFHNLVVACDMPFLNLDLLRYMVGIAGGVDVVMPRLDGDTEALHAIYSRDCLPPIEGLLQRGESKIVRFLDAVKVRFVERDEVERFDSQRLSFFNINTRSDLHYARSLVEKEAPHPANGYSSSRS